MRGPVQLAVALLALVVAGCRESEPAAAPTMDSPSHVVAQLGEADAVAVYAGALRRYLTFPGEAGVDARYDPVYVVDSAHVWLPGGNAGSGDGTSYDGEIPLAVQERVVAELADVATVQFIPRQDAVVTRAEGCEEVAGILVVLGPPLGRGSDGTGGVVVAVSGQHSCRDLSQRLYGLRQDGQWYIDMVWDLSGLPPLLIPS